jgi:hypothetical protein
MAFRGKNRNSKNRNSKNRNSKRNPNRKKSLRGGRVIDKGNKSVRLVKRVQRVRKDPIKNEIMELKNENEDKPEILKKLGMEKLECSPTVKKDKKYTCLSDEALNELKMLWNSRHPDVMIEDNDPRKIWESLSKKMSGICKRETCCLKQNFVEGKLDDELRDSYSPSMPQEWKKNKNEWLSSLDILRVMKQYEKAYPCFEFMGPSPIDFEKRVGENGKCVWDELCNFSLQEQINRGKTKVGIIFNTDPHYKSGSHWISMFIEIKKEKPMIYFFDSVGDKPPPEVQAFVEKVKKQGNELKHKINFGYDINDKEHQYGGTECGVYSLFFIVYMLKEKIDNVYLDNHTIKDEEIELFRKKFFNEEL